MNKSAYRLVMRRGPTPGLVIELSKSDMTIGRDLSNELVINDVEVSRKHLRLLLQGENYRIEDLGSTNGSFVNGQRLTGSHLLVPGDLVSLGEHVTLVYETAAYDPAATQVSASAGAAAVPVPACCSREITRSAPVRGGKPAGQPAARPAAVRQSPNSRRLGLQPASTSPVCRAGSPGSGGWISRSLGNAPQETGQSLAAGRWRLYCHCHLFPACPVYIH